MAEKSASIAELFSLAGKRVLITGSAAGIGKAIAIRFAEGGVIALTRALAKENGKAGFRINALIPGGIATEDTKGVAKSVLRGWFKLIGSGIKFTQRLPIGRIGQPDEIARMALVLASDV